MTSPQPIIIFGGETREALVSTATAQNLAQHVDDPTIWFWAKGGGVSEIPIQDLLTHQEPFKREFEVGDEIRRWGSLEEGLDSLSPPIVILALHGGMGENGTVQGWMEERNIPFIGSGSASSKLCFDKTAAKKAIQKAGMLVPESLDVIQSLDDIRDFFKTHGPTILKPNEDGSSFGLEFIRKEEDLSSRMRRDPSLDGSAHSTGPSEPETPSNSMDPRLRGEDRTRGNKNLIAEQLIEGTELTIPVIEMNGELRALSVIEIRKDNGREFDYAAKYESAGVAEICPAMIPDDLTREAQDIAIKCHRVLGCRGYSRTDVIAAKDGIYFLELNTLPGLTKESLIPKSLKVEGVGMREFLGGQMGASIFY